MSVAAFALQQQPFPLQHDHWLRPPAGPGAAVAAAASAYSRPAAGVPYVQPATPSAHALQAAANEVSDPHPWKLMWFKVASDSCASQHHTGVDPRAAALSDGAGGGVSGLPG